jgi:hypothetical protein
MVVHYQQVSFIPIFTSSQQFSEINVTWVSSEVKVSGELTDSQLHSVKFKLVVPCERVLIGPLCRVFMRSV